jgi:hypothetical protein
MQVVSTLRMDGAAPSLTHTCTQLAKDFSLAYICHTKYRKGGKLKGKLEEQDMR